MLHYTTDGVFFVNLDLETGGDIQSRVRRGCQEPAGEDIMRPE